MNMNWVDHLTLAEIDKIKEATNNGFVGKITDVAKLVSLNYCGKEFDPHNDDPSGEVYVQAGLDVKRPDKGNNSRLEYVGKIEIHDGGFLKDESDEKENYEVTFDKNGTSSIVFGGQSYNVLPSAIVGFYEKSVLSAVENALNSKQVESTRNLPKVGTSLLPLGKDVKPEVKENLRSRGYAAQSAILGNDNQQNNLMVRFDVCTSTLPWQQLMVNPFKGRMCYENYMDGFEIPVVGGRKILNDLQIELLGMENAVLEGALWKGLKQDEERIHLIHEAGSPR